MLHHLTYINNESVCGVKYGITTIIQKTCLGLLLLSLHQPLIQCSRSPSYLQVPPPLPMHVLFPRISYVVQRLRFVLLTFPKCYKRTPENIKHPVDS